MLDETGMAVLPEFTRCSWLATFTALIVRRTPRWFDNSLIVSITPGITCGPGPARTLRAALRGDAGRSRDRKVRDGTDRQVHAVVMLPVRHVLRSARTFLRLEYSADLDCSLVSR